MRKISIIFALFFVFPLFVYGQTLDEKLKEIDDYANTVMTTWKGPGMAIAVVKDDKTVMAKGYGVRELGKPDKVDADTLFAIASNTKAFTTASLAILVDEKKIAWNDKVSKYLPDFQLYDPWVTNELTIRDIVSHRVGLDTFSGDLLWYDTTYPTDEILRRVRFLKPVSSFRTRYGYQNLMYIAAGPHRREGFRQALGGIRQGTHPDAARYGSHNHQRPRYEKQFRHAPQRIRRHAPRTADRLSRQRDRRRSSKFFGK